jgi:hypothetical protein
MSNASRFKSVWDYIPKKAQKEQAKHMLENVKHLIIHEINKLVIFKMNGHYEVINKESLIVKFYDTEQECIDFCLDVYPESFFNIQQNIFIT